MTIMPSTRSENTLPARSADLPAADSLELPFATSPEQQAPYRFGFILQQVLGWVAVYQNFRRYADADASVRALWTEVTYRRDGGLIERIPGMPQRARGAIRGMLQVRQGLGPSSLPFASRVLLPRHDAVLFNSQSLCLGIESYLRRVPAVIVTDVTPCQLDDMGPLYGRAPRQDTWFAHRRRQAYLDIFHATRLIAPCSEWVKRSLMADYQVPEERILVTPHGVDTDQWRPPARPRGESREPESRPRILFVGGDFHRKGGDRLLDWYIQRGKDMCDLHMVTRTPPSLGESVPGLHFHVNLETNDAELVQLYHEADLFVLPTLADCFGVASIEAMATGLPVITSAVGGVPEIVDDGMQGYLIDPYDDLALAQRIELLVANPSLRLRLGNAARQKALDRFDARDNAQTLLDAMKRIALRRADRNDN